MKNAPSRSDGRFIMDRTLRNDFPGLTVDTNQSWGVVSGQHLYEQGRVLRAGDARSE